jgi:hypothetical protein
MLSIVVAPELGLHRLRSCYSNHYMIVSRHGECRMDVPFGPPLGLDNGAVSVFWTSSEIIFCQQWDNATSDWPVVKVH